jgi:hypothetical protein
MPAAVRRAGPAWQRATATWPPRAAPAQRLKAAVGTACPRVPTALPRLRRATRPSPRARHCRPDTLRPNRRGPKPRRLDRSRPPPPSPVIVSRAPVPSRRRLTGQRRRAEPPLAPRARTRAERTVHLGRARIRPSCTRLNFINF